ncbi:hypothetical protein XENOCAPTIV_017724 [Xenoophorus captivus]|uniref:Uncharacterized protein n=1 Tax=Xenoophorus captivus TaxID=1517983 RepID=A0ABV0QSE6_9TELE
MQNDSQQSSIPPSHPAIASSPSLPVHERETCTSQVTNRSRPSTTRMGSSTGTRHPPVPHPPDCEPQPSAWQGARATEGSIGGRPPPHAKSRAPRQFHTRTPEVPRHANHPHSRKAHPAAPSRPAG